MENDQLRQQRCKLNQKPIMQQPSKPAFVFLWIVACTCQVSAQNNIDALNKRWNEATTAYSDGKYEVAKKAAAEVVSMIPFEPSSRILLARCCARLGDNTKAIEQLKIAAESGWEDAESVATDSAFEALKQTEQFDDAIAKIEANQEREFVLYEGESIRPDELAPLVVLFHGRGELPNIQLRFWKKAAD
ncbi:MAG: hypothetical protein AAGA30_20005, partial [Planctomycetota bacterium]